MSVTRRGFLYATGSALAAASVPSVPSAAGEPTQKSVGNSGHIFVPRLGHWNDPDLFALAERGVDVAMSMGAQYADVRLTNSRHEGIFDLREIREDDEWFGIGVRILKDGHWGFLSSAVWTVPEIERLAHDAIKQAESFARHLKGQVVLAPPPASVSRGEWTMPIKYDPFDVPKGEKMDYLFYLFGETSYLDRDVTIGFSFRARRKISIFASSHNSQWKQTTYKTELLAGLGYPSQRSLDAWIGDYKFYLRPPMGKGWEYIIESDILSELPQAIEETKATRFSTPVEIDRYDAVLAPEVVASILGATIGGATELDRALGYEANSVGTSFLDDPLEMAGQYPIGSPKLTVTADRTMNGGLNTVKWDEEGVPVEPVVLVKEGVVTDFQTTRETAMHLAPYYQKHGKPVASNGSATSQSGLFITTQHTSNLRMEPGDTDLSFDDLVSQLGKGVAIVGIRYIEIDFQCLNATLVGQTREVRNGRVERYIKDAAFMIRTPEFWKNLTTLGGPSTQKTFGFSCKKGQPEQTNEFSVSAVPALFKNLGMIDESRR